MYVNSFIKNRTHCTENLKECDRPALATLLYCLVVTRDHMILCKEVPRICLPVMVSFELFSKTLVVFQYSARLYSMLKQEVLAFCSRPICLPQKLTSEFTNPRDLG